MAVNTDIRIVESSEAAENISVTPKRDLSMEQTAEEIFSAVKDVAESERAFILQERIFAAGEAMDCLSDTRERIFKDTDELATPTFLVCDELLGGPIAGVQVYAVRCDAKPLPVNIDGVIYGKVVQLSDRGYMTVSGLSAPELKTPVEQAAVMLEKAELALKQFNTDFLSVPRTWMWLGDILSWYADFNCVRNDLFTARGLIGKGTRQSMPASTGIGLAPADGGACAMDFTAVIEPADSTEFMQTVGKQQCAFEYGSAFSRASRAITPAGKTVFISGTASIDASGATTYINDATGQIEDTIENVRAVLGDMGCKDEDVVSIIAYCKDVEVEKAFREIKDKFDWPWVTVICDICRHNLLFEIEAAAMPQSK